MLMWVVFFVCYFQNILKESKQTKQKNQLSRFQCTHVSLNLFYLSFSADYFSQLTFCKTLQKQNRNTQNQFNQFNKWYSFCLSFCFVCDFLFSILLSCGIWTMFALNRWHRCGWIARKIHTQNRFKKTIFSIRSQYQFIDKKL